jgi:putative ABC transport system substrate-binding protein
VVDEVTGRDAQGRRAFLRRLARLSLLAVGLPASACRDPASPVAGAPRLRRIGYLDPGAPGSRPAELRAFRDQLRELGYVEGDTIAIEYRFAGGDATRLAKLAADLGALKLGAIVAFGTRAIQEIRDATRSSGVPIIMASSSDPVGSGLVESLPRPGGRITGLTSSAAELTGKRLQLLREAFPQASRVGYFWDSTNKGDYEERRRLEAAAAILGTRLISLDLRGTTRNFRAVLARAIDERAEAVITFASGIINNSPEPIVDFAAARSLPGMYAQREFVTEHGGLMAYGPSYPAMYQRAAVFIDKVLRGARPAELPVEKPRRFKLIINLQTARAFGFAIPRALLAQVDEVV